MRDIDTDEVLIPWFEEKEVSDTEVWVEINRKFKELLSATDFYKLFNLASLKTVNNDSHIVVIETYNQQSRDILNCTYKEILDNVVQYKLGKEYEVIVELKHEAEPVADLIASIEERLKEIIADFSKLKQMYENQCEEKTWIDEAEKNGLLQLLDY